MLDFGGKLVGWKGMRIMKKFSIVILCICLFFSVLFVGCTDTSSSTQRENTTIEEEYEDEEDEEDDDGVGGVTIEEHWASCSCGSGCICPKDKQCR